VDRRHLLCRLERAQPGRLSAALIGGYAAWLAGPGQDGTARESRGRTAAICDTFSAGLWREPPAAESIALVGSLTDGRGSFAVVVLPIGGMELAAVEAAGQTLHVPRFAVDYTSGLYAVLLGLGYAGGVMYMIAYVLLAVHFFREDQSGVVQIAVPDPIGSLAC